MYCTTRLTASRLKDEPGAVELVSTVHLVVQYTYAITSVVLYHSRYTVVTLQYLVRSAW